MSGKFSAGRLRASGIVAALCLLAFWAGVPALLGKTIYVDNKLGTNCPGAYSFEKRDGSGHDGDGYMTVVEAANIAEAGDTVVIRAGVYHANNGLTQNDVLWPKHSGTKELPIVFKANAGETVVLGESLPDYPAEDSNTLSIAGGVVTMKGISHISIEGLEFRKVAGWVFARNCHHIVFKDCVFADALRNAKADARLIECQFCKFLNCTFMNAYDSLSLNKSDWIVVQDCSFSSAAHTPLALRSCNYCVIRNCRFENPFYLKNRAEKLVEVYDIKVDRRDPANPVVLEMPAYNSTKHNLFEYNFFGYHPYRPNAASQPSAMQYSGQDGIIRRNVYANPEGRHIDPNNPGAVSGGMGIRMRWGGSWDGWREKKDGNGGRWWGESMEAGYVTHNRIYNNVFFGYDGGCIVTPSEDSMGKSLNPPPLYETNPSKQYDEKYAFEDNVFINNILSPGRYNAHVKWAWAQGLTGKSMAVTMRGPMNGLRFLNNDFYDSADHTVGLVAMHEAVGKKSFESVAEPGTMDRRYSGMFSQSLAKDPLFVNAEQDDFRLREGSPLIDAGAFLTAAVGGGSGAEIRVKDAGIFFDGFGIEGEQGDLIQLQGQTETARITHVDYARRMLTLDHPLTWQSGQGVTLAYSGSAPDLGVHELGLPTLIGPPPGSKTIH